MQSEFKSWKKALISSIIFLSFHLISLLLKATSHLNNKCLEQKIQSPVILSDIKA